MDVDHQALSAQPGLSIEQFELRLRHSSCYLAAGGEGLGMGMDRCLPDYRRLFPGCNEVNTIDNFSDRELR